MRAKAHCIELGCGRNSTCSAPILLTTMPPMPKNSGSPDARMHTLCSLASTGDAVEGRGQSSFEDDAFAGELRKESQMPLAAGQDLGLATALTARLDRLTQPSSPMPITVTDRLGLMAFILFPCIPCIPWLLIPWLLLCILYSVVQTTEYTEYTEKGLSE